MSQEDPHSQEKRQNSWRVGSEGDDPNTGGAQETALGVGRLELEKPLHLGVFKLFIKFRKKTLGIQYTDKSRVVPPICPNTLTHMPNSLRSNLLVFICQRQRREKMSPENWSNWKEAMVNLCMPGHFLSYFSLQPLPPHTPCPHPSHLLPNSYKKLSAIILVPATFKIYHTYLLTSFYLYGYNVTIVDSRLIHRCLLSTYYVHCTQRLS